MSEQEIMASTRLFQALLLASSLGWNGVFANQQQYGGQDQGMSESGLIIPRARLDGRIHEGLC